MNPQDRAVCVYRRITAALSTLLTLILLGCMCPVIVGERFKKKDDETLCQTGEVRLSSGEQDVYYPVPFASTPNLELDPGMFVQILDQKPDHFRIGSSVSLGNVDWKARGIRSLPAVGTTLETGASPVTATSAGSGSASGSASGVIRVDAPVTHEVAPFER
jgi:hypothetical protein